MSQPYTSGPTGGGAPIRNEIDFGAFGRAFEIAKSNVGMFIVAGLITLLPTILISVVFRLVTPQPDRSDPAAAAAMLGPMLGLSLLQNVVSALLQGALSVAMASFCLGAIRKGTADLSDYTAGFKYVGPAMLAGLLVQFATGLGVLACCVGAFVVYAILMLTYNEIADGNTNVIEAAMASVDKMKDKILPAIAFGFVSGLVVLAGVIACGVGIFFTMPLAMTALSLVYCDLTGTGPGAAAAMPSAGISPYPRGASAPQETSYQPGTPYPPQDEPPTPPAPPEA